MTDSSFDQLMLATRGTPPSGDRAAALGLRALEERREEDALPLVVSAAWQAPTDARLLHILGLLHRAVGDLASAITVLDRAVARAPGSARLVHARARATFEAGLPSLEWYQRARALAPNDGDVILGHAAALLAARQSATADGLLTAMVRKHPGWLPGHAALSRLRYASGDAANYVAELDTAIAGAPGDVRLHHLKIMTHYRAGAAKEAHAALAAARRAIGDTLPLIAAQAMLATEYGQLDAADAAFARLDPLSDGDLAIHWLRHLLRRKEPDRVAALDGKLSTPMTALALPYLSLAWRLTGDPRANLLEDDRFVSVIDFGADWPLLAPLADALRRLHITRSQPLDQSVRGGTQTDGPLLSRVDPVIRAVRDRFAAEVSSYISRLPGPERTHPFPGRVPRHPRFVGSWSVRLTDGGFHEPHIHGEGWLSSAFYLAVPTSPPDSEAGWLTLGEPQRSLGLDFACRRAIEPRPGRLVLFPSTCWHGTRAFERGERLTIAFDIA